MRFLVLAKQGARNLTIVSNTTGIVKLIDSGKTKMVGRLSINLSGGVLVFPTM